MKKLKQGGKKWLESLRETVLSECPTLIECKKCGYIIRDGYVCYCGCDSPGNNEINPDEWM